LPTESSARIVRNTQLILQHETSLTDVVDPLGDSYFVEAMTSDLVTEAWRLIDEVEKLGGMTKAVEQGLPRIRIEEAARARATVGEISLALEKAFHRHQAVTQMVSSVFGSAYEKDPEFEVIQYKISHFKSQNNQPPRILIAKMGHDSHDRGAKAVATEFADIGFEVDLSDLFETPSEMMRRPYPAA